MSFAAAVIKNLSILVALIFTAALPLARQAQPKLKPGLDSLAFFQGAWNCDGKFSKDNRKISSDMTFQPDLEGAGLSLPDTMIILPIVSMPWNSGVLTRRQISFKLL